MSENISPVPPPEQDLVALIKKIQEHLFVLERKVDILINKSQERPFSKERPHFKDRHFKKPFRSFGHSQQHGKGERDHGPREGGFQES